MSFRTSFQGVRGSLWSLGFLTWTQMVCCVLVRWGGFDLGPALSGLGWAEPASAGQALPDLACTLGLRVVQDCVCELNWALQNGGGLCSPFKNTETVPEQPNKAYANREQLTNNTVSEPKKRKQVSRSPNNSMAFGPAHPLHDQNTNR